jgi:hypothetical protein
VIPLREPVVLCHEVYFERYRDKRATWDQMVRWGFDLFGEDCFRIRSSTMDKAYVVRELDKMGAKFRWITR